MHDYEKYKYDQIDVDTGLPYSLTNQNSTTESKEGKSWVGKCRNKITSFLKSIENKLDAWDEQRITNRYGRTPPKARKRLPRKNLSHHDRLNQRLIELGHSPRAESHEERFNQRLAELELSLETNDHLE